MAMAVVDLEIARARAQIATRKRLDLDNRITDACTHFRKGMALLEEALEPSPESSKAVELFCEGIEILTGGGH